MKCVNCNLPLLAGSRFCSNCGSAIKKPSIEQESIDENIQIILDTFYSILQQTVEEEQDGSIFDQYVQCFLAKEYNQKVIQIGLEFEQKGYDLRQEETQVLLAEKLRYAVDTFLIRFCPQLNINYLPEAILSYAAIDKYNQIDLFQMILDFLYFQGEREQVYFDFTKMPPKKFKRAAKSFLFASPTERVFFICDQSFLRSGKEGFAMTDKALYWKHAFQPARSLSYNAIESIEIKEDWLMLNNQFFAVNQGFNVKMARLLRKLNHLK